MKLENCTNWNLFKWSSHKILWQVTNLIPKYLERSNIARGSVGITLISVVEFSSVCKIGLWAVQSSMEGVVIYGVGDISVEP